MARQFLTLVTLLICTAPITIIAKQQASLIPGFSQCTFNNISYPVGTHFHPKIQFGAEIFESICTECICHATTLVQCSSVTCPPLDCSNPVAIPGQCCRVCPGNDTSGIQLVPYDREHKSCIYNGISYSHGMTFHPSDVVASGDDESDIIVTNVFCISCSCNNGTSTCQDVSNHCPSLVTCDASEAVLPEGSCCPVCPDVPLEQGECKDERGIVRQPGQKWNYYSSIYSKELPCINCTCINGRTSCAKLPCPSVPVCTGREPETHLCCPTCRSEGSNPTDSPATTPTTPILVNCDHAYPFKVYECPDQVSMAIENITSGIVHWYFWLPEQVRQSDTLTSEEFVNTECKNYYVGSTIERRVTGLSTKPSKKSKIENCTSNCANLVVRMLRAVPPEEQVC